MNRRTTLIGFFCAVLALFVVVPSALVWREYRQAQLNRDLLVAAKKMDASAVLSLLDRGADANTHDFNEYPRVSFLCRLQGLWHRPSIEHYGFTPLTYVLDSDLAHTRGEPIEIVRA